MPSRSLTNEIEKGALAYIEKIDATGGMLRAIESGFVQGEIQKAAYEYQRAVERHEQIVVGVNEFVAEEDRSHSDAAHRPANRADPNRPPAVAPSQAQRVASKPLR